MATEKLYAKNLRQNLKIQQQFEEKSIEFDHSPVKNLHNFSS